jgi:hypothetical protein
MGTFYIDSGQQYNLSGIYIYIHTAANILEAYQFQIYWDRYLITYRADMDYIGLLNVLVFDKTDKAAKLTDL